jgi:hypothetical protein
MLAFPLSVGRHTGSVVPGESRRCYRVYMFTVDVLDLLLVCPLAEVGARPSTATVTVTLGPRKNVNPV